MTFVRDLLTGGSEDGAVVAETPPVPDHATLTVACDGSSKRNVPFDVTTVDRKRVTVRVHAMKASDTPQQLHFSWGGKTTVFVVSQYRYVGTNDVHQDWSTDGYMMVSGVRP